jgi:transposase
LGLGFKNHTKEDSYLKSATPDTYITATQVCELRSKIADLGLIIPITLVLDNARYQKCKIVEKLALSLSIELLYLPSYSPNLNLIERLWKFVKKKCGSSVIVMQIINLK